MLKLTVPLPTVAGNEKRPSSSRTGSPTVPPFTSKSDAVRPVTISPKSTNTSKVVWLVNDGTWVEMIGDGGSVSGIAVISIDQIFCKVQ